MGPAYDREIDSPIADMKNIGSRAGGSITAAQFLARFVGDTPWAHIDIAGVAARNDAAPTCPKGASGLVCGCWTSSSTFMSRVKISYDG